MPLYSTLTCIVLSLLLLVHSLQIVYSLEESVENFEQSFFSEALTANNGDIGKEHTPIVQGHLLESEISTKNDSARKVDELGSILKRKVETLLRNYGRKLDVVFLVDASSSVGDHNFNSELKFVKKLLADFSISLNETRVAVITFSDQDKVFRHVDHISVPSEENHKCNMLHNDLPNIKYSGGLTYTLGALVEAQAVLEWSRAGAQKAIFLLTDGFSNGGDPIQVAEILKDNGTFIFTFGIQSGNIEELQGIASSPAEEFSYLVDGFDQFEAVVRRALHQDLSIGSYQLLNDSSLCNSLCSETEKGENGCCDSQAHCSCGTGSGHYRCLCNPGHYGAGLRNSCHPCPNGTYHDGQTPGDESVCSLCPDPNHITMMGHASSRVSCMCKRGFVARGDFCEVITCPLLYPPQHGYFVKGGMCLNVFNAACGMRCKAGYTLHGSSIRLCQENGTWSGKAPKCIVKMCPIPEVPANGEMKCSLEPSVSNDLLDPLYEEPRALVHQYAVDTECQFSCSSGHTISGSRRRICLPLARWDGLRTVCKPVTCRPLPKLVHGSIAPASCTDTMKLPFGQKCNITCNDGYKLVGPASRKCDGKGGQWSLKSSPSKCFDEQPPVIICPDNIEAKTDSGEAFATVIIPKPSVSDNSGKTPITWSQPTVSSPMKIPIGVLQITFIAMDPSHNQALCNMTITVIDKEPPVLESCISPKPIHLLETGGNRTVKWVDPEFYDNSGKQPTIETSHAQREFPVGKTEVAVIAYDESGNNSTCMLEVIVKDSPCSQQPPKLSNAVITCLPEQNGQTNCSLTCAEGYAFDTSNFEEEGLISDPRNGSFLYSCSDTKDDVQPFTLPECGEIVLPNSIYQGGEVSFIASRGACNDSELIAKMRNAVELELSKTSDEFCKQSLNLACQILNTNASCEEIASLEEEETNIIHHAKRSLLSDSNSPMKEEHAPRIHPYNPLSDKARLLRRETMSSTASGSSINVQFEVIGHFWNITEKRKPDLGLLENTGFRQLKDSLGRATIPLPSNIKGQTLHWKGKGHILACSDGSVAHTSGICVKCPSGTYFSNAFHKCLPCALGEYQNSDGKTECLRCPKGKSTKYGGSRSEHDCLYLCRPGSFGRILVSNPSQREGSVSSCSLCHPGTYQPNYGATSCIPCPSGPHSYKRGAKSVNDCFKPVGMNQWLHPVNCVSHLCQNGASCRSISLGFISCDCQPGFYGSLCESAINLCSSSPCFNGGECIEKLPLGYTCKCLPGFHGQNCEEEIDECHPNPCVNNSSCVDLRDGFYCDCTDGFQGLSCEENINDCYNNPCGDHGLCVDGISNYSCSCIHGYSGHNCENEPVDPCLDDNPCLNGGTCMNHDVSMYRCLCPSGWGGKHCHLQNSCSSSPCLNDGTCHEKKDGGFFCQCQIPFGGDFCQTRLRSDFVMHMHSPSVTDYAIVDFSQQNLSEITACVWLQSKDGFNYGTAFSYANKYQFNAFTLTDYNGFVLYVNGQRVVTDVSANDGLWHHVCVLWQSKFGAWDIYLDGSLKDRGSWLSPNESILGSGKLVVGQEQDSLGGGFSEAESLIGRIYQLIVWDKVLDPTRIHQLANECWQSFDESIVKWSDFFPRIHGKVKMENSTFCTECHPPDPLWHGTVTLIAKPNGTVASYACENGFVFFRSKLRLMQRRCLKQGSWEGIAPICVRQSCGFPGYLPGGTFFGRSFLYTDTVNYTCHHGSLIIGNASRTCQADGKWSGDPPICKGLECPPLTVGKYGNIVFGKKAGGIQTASFSCDDGYVLDGAHLLTCMHDGMWDESVPDCFPIKCLPPPIIQHAFIKNNSVKSYWFMDEIHYECEPGYVLQKDRSAILYCDKGGIWLPHGHNFVKGINITIPSCEPELCTEPDTLNQGKWILKHGSLIDAIHYSLGSAVVAECESQFQLVGPKTKNCNERIWLPEDITQCVKVTCDTEELPYHIPHSTLHLSGEEVGDTATLTCKTGYQLSTAQSNGPLLPTDLPAEVFPNSSLVWKCNLDGTWVMNGTKETGSSSEAEWIACLPKTVKSSGTSIKCGKPQAPAFGYLVTSTTEIHYVAGSVIEVSCRTGFWPDGPTILTCDLGGNWTASPVCRSVKCRPPPKFPNMSITSTTSVGQDWEFGNLVIFSCIPGFRVQGDLSIRCQSTGKWSTLRGKCLLN